jgi:putative ABC transport system ATP-binding protein
MIHTERLTKVFRTDEIETVALREVDLQIEEGEFVAIMGPSGCGKSTLLNLLGLLDQPTGGTYRFRGQDTGTLNNKEKSRLLRDHIGFVFQNFVLMDELTVFENIRIPLSYHHMSMSARRQRVHAVMNQMRIGHRARHYPQQLSGGQQQRVAIARAVIARPNLILADEPTGNLDSKNGIEVMNLLSSLNREGATIVMATHNLRDAGFANRTIQLLDGQLEPESARHSIQPAFTL